MQERKFLTEMKANIPVLELNHCGHSFDWFIPKSTLDSVKLTGARMAYIPGLGSKAVI